VFFVFFLHPSQKKPNKPFFSKSENYLLIFLYGGGFHFLKFLAYLAFFGLCCFLIVKFYSSLFFCVKKERIHNLTIRHTHTERESERERARERERGEADEHQRDTHTQRESISEARESERERDVQQTSTSEARGSEARCTADEHQPM
jgi:hypothetical protein